MRHGGPETKADRADGPGCKALPDGDHSERGRLDGQPARDQALAAHSIGKCARAHLAGSPHKRIESDKRADLHQGQSPLSEEQRKQSPGHSVVEVVRQSRGTTGGKRALTKARFGEDMAYRDTLQSAPVLSRTTLEAGMVLRLAHQED